mgnify:CR=1 FL=1
MRLGARHKGLFSLVLAASCIATDAALASFTDGLELYFKLDETSGLTAADSSGLGRDGAVVNRGGSINRFINGEFPPNDPLVDNGFMWVPGRFGGGFAPAGAPDIDGDPNPPTAPAFPEFSTSPDTQLYAGSAFAMIGVNLTNGATTGGLPANIVSQQFTYSFHVRMPYNLSYSKAIGAKPAGAPIATGGDVFFDVSDVRGDLMSGSTQGLGLASELTNFWPSVDGSIILPSDQEEHLAGNQWSKLEVGFGGRARVPYRAGALTLNSNTTPQLFDVNTVNPGLLVNGQWHHVALVHDYTIGPDDGSLQDAFLYINGNLIQWATIQGSTAVNALLGAITLGSAANTRGGDAAKFYFDDFAVWSRALSPQEIAQLSTQSLNSILNNADFNGDNFVDGADFLIWQRGLGLTGQVDRSNGDANLDSFVDDLDLALWQEQYGQIVSNSTAASTAAPEPSGLVMAPLAWLFLRRRRQRQALSCCGQERLPHGMLRS